MTTCSLPSSNGVALRRLPLFAGLLLGAGVASAANLNLPAAPLFISSSVAPNIMIMLDNSGSMQNIVPDAPYDPAVNYANCSGKSRAPNVSIDLVVANSTSGVPLLYYSSGGSFRLYNYGTGGKHDDDDDDRRCFNPDIVYDNVRLLPDASNTSFRFPSSYLGTPYDGNYLNWYFGTTVGGAAWNAGQQFKPLGGGQFTRSRIQIVRTSASALIDSLDARLRVGLTAYNPNAASGRPGLFGGLLHDPVSPLGGVTSTKRSQLKSRIDALTAAGATPLASTLSDIGRYFARGNTRDLTLHPGAANQSQRSVVDVFNNHELHDPESLGTANPVEFSCQRNFVLLLTDGRPQQDQVISPLLADYDGDCTAANGCVTPPTTCSVANDTHCDKKPDRTYETLGSDYMDDVAQALRQMDLRPDFPAEADGSQFINNIVTYLIGFADPAVQDDPLVKATADATHGGGGFFAASNAGQLAQTFVDVTGNILRTSGSFSAVTANSTRLEAGAKVFQARFNSGDWSGDLQAYEISTAPGGPCPATPRGNLCTTPVWRAGSLINSLAPNARTILSYRTDSRVAIPFRWTSLNAAQQGALNANPNSSTAAADGHGSKRLDYLRGDRTYEAATASPPFRVRSSVLGDVVASDPAFVGAPPFAYGFNNYASFRSSNAARKPMVYVGANDGMLHGFDADTGAEKIAYVPSKLYGAAGAPKIGRLTQRVYTHQHGVDGAPVVGDAYIGSSWKSVLVSGLRAGGQGFFALDVTNPGLFAESNLSTLMWEFNDTDDADLGFSFSKPSIVKMANGKWAAIFGNGYNNTQADGAASGNGRAALFIVFLDGPSSTGWGATGTRYVKLLTSKGSTASPNGLATPAAVDLNGDDVVDYIYAGDELGNMWRFDVADASTTNWKVGYGNQPLFTATDTGGNVQPITARPEVGLNRLLANPANPAAPRLAVYFGTGRYLDAGDNSVASQVTQTFYGIFDDFGATAPTIARGNLLQQSILGELTAGSGTCGSDPSSACYRLTSNNAFTNADGKLDGKRGWYIDLLNTGVTVVDNQGERQVTTPALRNGKIIFTTLIPAPDPCDYGGGGWLLELDARTGARLAKPTVDTNNDGVITEADNIAAGDPSGRGGAPRYTVSGVRSTVGILATPAFLSVTENLENKYLGGSTASVGVIRESTNGRWGRISWREIIQ